MMVRDWLSQPNLVTNIRYKYEFKDYDGLKSRPSLTNINERLCHKYKFKIHDGLPYLRLTLHHRHCCGAALIDKQRRTKSKSPSSLVAGQEVKPNVRGSAH